MEGELTVLPHVGADRHLWSQLGHSDTDCLLSCVLQLPTTADAEADSLWCRVVDALDADLQKLSQTTCGGTLRRGEFGAAGRTRAAVLQTPDVVPVRATCRLHA